METVKEFKDAGLVFVEGDKYENITSQCLNDWQWRVNHGSSGWNDDKIEEFAWRKNNTGEKPSFSGVIEVKFADCSTATESRQSNWNWTRNLPPLLAISEWRPVISKEDKMEGKTNEPRANERVEIPECKPTYTKEMHDAGELPPVGAVILCDVFNRKTERMMTRPCEILKHKNDKCAVIEVSTGHLYWSGSWSYCKTEEERLIDEACAEMLAIDATPVDTSEKAVIELMIKAGYRKP